MSGRRAKRRGRSGRFFGRKRAQRAAQRGSSGKGQMVVVNPQRSRGFLPMNYRTTMDYVYSWHNTTAIPGFYDWVHRGNDVYDPDVAVGGNSAYGLDELANLYQFYKVIGSTARVTVTALTSDPVHVAIVPNQISAGFAAAQQDGVLVHPFGRHFTVAQYNGAKTLSNQMTTAAAMNVKDIDDVGFQAALNASPTHLWYWHVVTWNNVGNASDCDMVVHISFDVVLSGLKAFSV